jgi:hypothetical protein
MRYRNLVVMLPVLLFFFFSCKKGGANKETYYMNAEIDGTLTSFPIGTPLKYQMDTFLYLLSIKAACAQHGNFGNAA